MYDALWPWLHLLGRVCYGVVMISFGANHFLYLDNMTAYTASKKIPAPKVGVLVSGTMLVIGGASIALGWHRFIGAGLLVIFLLSAAFLIHPFWKETEPNARAAEQIQFKKDLALAGAALFFLVQAGEWWPLSVGH